MNAHDQITVTLTAAEWNQAMAMMAKIPFETSADIILKIRNQCMASQKQTNMPTAKPNGGEMAKEQIARQE